MPLAKWSLCHSALPLKDNNLNERWDQKVFLVSSQMGPLDSFSLWTCIASKAPEGQWEPDQAPPPPPRGSYRPTQTLELAEQIRLRRHSESGTLNWKQKHKCTFLWLCLSNVRLKQTAHIVEKNVVKNMTKVNASVSLRPLTTTTSLVSTAAWRKKSGELVCLPGDLLRVSLIRRSKRCTRILSIYFSSFAATAPSPAARRPHPPLPLPHCLPTVSAQNRRSPVGNTVRNTVSESPGRRRTVWPCTATAGPPSRGTSWKFHPQTLFALEDGGTRLQHTSATKLRRKFMLRFRQRDGTKRRGQPPIAVSRTQLSTPGGNKTKLCGL